MWRVKPGERVSLWCTLLVFKIAYGKCCMPPVVVHQDKEYSQDILHNIPLDWKFHHRPSGYMDRYGRIKAMNQFHKICGAYSFNNQILFFDGNESHFDNRTPTQMQRKTSSPSYLNWVTPSTTSPMTTSLTKNWEISITLWSLSVCWSMITRGFNLVT